MHIETKSRTSSCVGTESKGGEVEIVLLRLASRYSSQVGDVPMPQNQPTECLLDSRNRKHVRLTGSFSPYINI